MLFVGEYIKKKFEYIVINLIFFFKLYIENIKGIEILEK